LRGGISKGGIRQAAVPTAAERGSSFSFSGWRTGAIDPELPLDLRKTGHLGCSMTLVSAVIFPVTQRPRAGCERGADVQVAGGKRLTMHPVLIGELIVASIRCNCAL